MIENLKVTITAHERTAAFTLTFDGDFQSDRDMRICIDRDGGCEQEVVHLLMRVLQPGDVCVDGGANVGYFTCLMSQLVGPSGLVFAVEPAPANIHKLEHNLANNAARNVRVVKSPLYSDIREMTMHLSQHSGLNSLTAGEHTVGKMNTVTTTIDAMLDGQVPKLIKLDIEGAEYQALRGGLSSIFWSARQNDCQCPYVVVELNEQALSRFGSSRDEVRMYMEYRGYFCFILQKDGVFPLQVPINTEIVCDRENLMVLFSTPENVAKAWPKLELT